MPPRTLTWSIVIAWTAMSSWLFYRDLWPQLQHDDPPPFKIDFSDEVLVKRPPVRWTVLRNGKATYVMKSEMSYDADLDLFEMSSELNPKPGLPADTPLFERISMKSVYVVTRDGELRKFSINTTVPFFGEVKMDGEYRGDQLISRVAVPGFGFKKDLDPVKVVAKGNALNPLQPMDRLSHLQPGREWNMTLSEPLIDALSGVRELKDISMFKDNSVKQLRAKVLADEYSLKFGAREESCYVIEYTGDDAHGKTWVRASDGLVLKQEFTLRDDDWVLLRDP
jgi:hypothetical protein